MKSYRTYIFGTGCIFKKFNWNIVGLHCCVTFRLQRSDSVICIHILILFQILYPYQFSSVQSLSHVRLFATPWTEARQASLSIANSQSLLKLYPYRLLFTLPHSILSRGPSATQWVLVGYLFFI